MEEIIRFDAAPRAQEKHQNDLVRVGHDPFGVYRGFVWWSYKFTAVA